MKEKIYTGLLTGEKVVWGSNPRTTNRAGHRKSIEMSS